MCRASCSFALSSQPQDQCEWGLWLLLGVTAVHIRSGSRQMLHLSSGSYPLFSSFLSHPVLSYWFGPVQAVLFQRRKELMLVLKWKWKKSSCFNFFVFTNTLDMMGFVYILFLETVNIRVWGFVVVMETENLANCKSCSKHSARNWWLLTVHISYLKSDTVVNNIKLCWFQYLQVLCNLSQQLCWPQREFCMYTSKLQLSSRK